MNRTLIFGLSTFSALLALAVLVGDNSRAIAGHGHSGHRNSSCDGIAYHSHGYLAPAPYMGPVCPQPAPCNLNPYCGTGCGICGPGGGYAYGGGMGPGGYGGGYPYMDAGGNMIYGGGYYPGAGGMHPYYGGNGFGAKTDQELIQGAWKVTKATVAGMDLTGDQLAQEFQTMTFTADTATGSGREEKSGGYTIDPSKSPKEIDFADDLAGKAIYEFVDYNTLRICVAVGDAERPQEFRAEQGDAGRFLLELQREQPISSGTTLDPPTEIVPGVETPDDPDAPKNDTPAGPGAPAINSSPVPGPATPGPLNSSAETPETILVVNVPVDAKLFLLGKPTDIAGTAREFVTTGLPTGNNVEEYTIRIEVTRDGKVMTDQKVITLTGGERHELTFDVANLASTN